MSLPDIEDYIGHKIPAANYTEEQLPKIERPARKPRRSGPPGKRSGGRGDRRPRRQNPR